MSIRAERLKLHPVWASLDALGAAIDDALKREGLSPSDADNLARIRSVLALAGKRLAGLDSQTIHFGLLDATANSLNDVAAHVRNFASNGNSGHLDQANASADNAIGSLAAVTLETSEGFIWAKEAAQAYQLGLATVMASAEATGAKVKEDLTGIQARQAELVAEITNEKQRIAATVAAHQAQFSTAQEGRVKEWSEQTKQHDVSLTALHKSFTDKLDASAKQFEAAVAQLKADQEQVRQSLREEFVQWAEIAKQQMEQKKKEVEELLGVIGTLGMTAGYRKTADQARWSGMLWRGGTVVALLVLAVIASVTVFQAVQGDFTWMKLSGRLFVSVAFGVLAAYCGAQADRYQKTEAKNRQMALELEALGPFLAPLPKDQQDLFRNKIGDRAFGHTEGRDGTEGRSPTSSLDVLNSKEVGDLAVLFFKKLLAK